MASTISAEVIAFRKPCRLYNHLHEVQENSPSCDLGLDRSGTALAGGIELMAAELPQSESTALFAPELFLANQPATRYVLALGLTILALLVRWLINPVLGDLGPFLSVYASVTLAAVYLGAGPATLTALIGLIGNSRWFLLQGQLKFESRSDLAYSAGVLLVSG